MHLQVHLEAQHVAREDPLAAKLDPERLATEVRELATPLADELGVDLVDVEVKGQTGSRVLKLIADAFHPGEELDIDQIAKLSRQVGDALDETDLVPGAYTLEVSSPGATRPLVRQRDFARNVGREVRVHLREGVSPGEVRGKIVAADDEVITVTNRDGEHRVPLGDVDHGKVVLPW